MPAYLGVEVTDAYWKPYFSRQGWYRWFPPIPEMSAKRLPEVARRNLAWLNRELLKCKKDRSRHVSRSHRTAITDWFRNLKEGNIKLPQSLYADCRPTQREEATRWLRNRHLFRFNERTRAYYDEDHLCGPEQLEPGASFVTVHTSSPDISCVDWDADEDNPDAECGPFEWISFVFDKAGKMSGLSVVAAACPFVYVRDASGETHRVGEILRNLPTKRHEREQSLTLPEIADAQESLRVTIAEEKSETTYLNFVALEVRGQQILPDQCLGDRAPSYCVADERYKVLEKGEHLDLSFSMPRPNGPLRLIAKGYYEARR